MTRYILRHVRAACFLLVVSAAQAGEVELIVSGFGSDNVVRYDSQTAAPLGSYAGGGLDGPWDATMGPDGNLYVASSGTNEILRYHGTTGAFIGSFTVGGGLSAPTGAVFGPDGNLYVSNTAGLNVVRYNGLTGSFVETFIEAGSGGSTGPTLLAFVPEPSGMMLLMASGVLVLVKRT